MSVAQKTHFVNSGVTVNTAYVKSDGVILVENDNRNMGFGIEIRLKDAITFAKAILAMTGEANSRLPSDEEMRLMDADYREQMAVGMDFDF